MTPETAQLLMQMPDEQRFLLDALPGDFRGFIRDCDDIAYTQEVERVGGQVHTRYRYWQWLGDRWHEREDLNWTWRQTA